MHAQAEGQKRARGLQDIMAAGPPRDMLSRMLYYLAQVRGQSPPSCVDSVLCVRRQSMLYAVEILPAGEPKPSSVLVLS